MHTYGITFATSSITTTILLTKISHAMFIISPRVVNTINSLPVADREPISRALSREFILGEDPEQTLTPVQCMVYAMIRFYVNQDTERGLAGVACDSFNPCGRALG